MVRSRINVRTLASMREKRDRGISESSSTGYTLSPVRNAEATALLERIETATAPSGQDVGILKFGRKSHRSLCAYHELPGWQKDNDYIHHGYVRETNSFHCCLDTLLFFNNETINIFSHLLPGAILPLLLALVPYYMAHSNFLHYIPPILCHLPYYSTTDAFDFYIFGLFTLGFVTCLSCSAMFHMLKVHSKRVAAMGSRLDYAGIILLIGSSLIGIIHYSLIDHPVAKNSFIAVTSTIGTGALLCTWHPSFRSPEWRAFRTATFVTYALSGLIPILYGFVMFDFTHAVNRAGLTYVLYEAAAYLSGATLYAFRLPERWIPGKVDMLGNSHQIFHVLVVMGAWFHFQALVASYHFAKLHTLGGVPL